jgi:hypothetical protein
LNGWLPSKKHGSIRGPLKNLARGVVMRKKSLVDRFGTLPPGMSKADIDVLLQFLYGAFDKRTAKEIQISHPYAEEDGGEVPQMTIAEFCTWLQSAA